MWSVLLSVGGIAGIWLAGRKSYWGWALGLAMQLLWLTYALITAQYGFILSAAGYGYIYALNLRKWRREKMETAQHDRDDHVRPGGVEELG